MFKQLLIKIGIIKTHTSPYIILRDANGSAIEIKLKEHKTMYYYYLEFSNGNYCDIRRTAPLINEDLNTKFKGDVILSVSPYKRTPMWFNGSEIETVRRLPSNYMQQGA